MHCGYLLFSIASLPAVFNRFIINLYSYRYHAHRHQFVFYYIQQKLSKLLRNLYANFNRIHFLATYIILYKLNGWVKGGCPQPPKYVKHTFMIRIQHETFQKHIGARRTNNGAIEVTAGDLGSK